jgi:cytochrome d ubiquinol oxidase subunit II
MTFRSYYTGGVFDLLSPVGILAGVCSVVMILMHGSAYAARRSEGNVRMMAAKVHGRSALLLLLLFAIAGCYVVFSIKGYVLLGQAKDPVLYPLKNLVAYRAHAWIDSFAIYPWKFIPPVLAFAAIVATLWANYLRWFNWAFWSSAIAVSSVIGTAGASLFPFIMPSSTHPNQSITVWNAVSSQYALNIMLYVGVFLLLVILGYKIYTFSTIWSKKPTLTESDIEQNSHSFY